MAVRNPLAAPPRRASEGSHRHRPHPGLPCKKPQEAQWGRDEKRGCDVSTQPGIPPS